ncbi:hypothetical protein HCN44_010943 [Aphidius gifuensis]|uniref:Uncharacterized protein n=1 Tax=Aphidius gifuensis TaxID=684658 RepID=A0A834Y364_APHGI|nr:hypothetical protein HCN44_010943 [Aphidius gifuensis]
MSDLARIQVQTRWKFDDVKIVCATIVFGMGVDNLLFMLHYQIKKNSDDSSVSPKKLELLSSTIYVIDDSMDQSAVLVGEIKVDSEKENLISPMDEPVYHRIRHISDSSSDSDDLLTTYKIESSQKLKTDNLKKEKKM